ncbi:MAG TPA: biopolymer transporter ExbD [Gemmataceae bacterium]|nr:biopolymer transporter ExbD [Gemmataceae bacterium]
MPWQLRHEGSPEVLLDLSPQEIVDGLRDGMWETTDEVLGPGEAAWRKIEAHPQFVEVAEELAVPPPVRHEEPSSLDMNALIDVCLVLLIFFMITTAYAALVQKSVPLPTTKTDAKGMRVLRVDQVKSQMIRVQAYRDKSGKINVLVQNQTVKDAVSADGKIDVDRVRDAIEPYVKGEDRKTEVLLDAREVTWENVIQIQDGARAAGVQIVHHLLLKK